MNVLLPGNSATVVLHSERAVELPERRTVAIADVHWGKATALRANGVPVPAGGTTADLSRLGRLLEKTHAERLLILGDLAHSRHGWDRRALQPVLAWRARWPDLLITLVRGNHDAHAGDPPAELRIDTLDTHSVDDVVCAHEPPGVQTEGITLCGHLHPTIKLAGRGGDRVRLSCFVLGPNYLILPAFSAFTGSGAWTPSAGERAFAIIDDHVAEVPV